MSGSASFPGEWQVPRQIIALPAKGKNEIAPSVRLAAPQSVCHVSNADGTNKEGVRPEVHVVENFLKSRLGRLTVQLRSAVRVRTNMLWREVHAAQ